MENNSGIHEGSNTGDNASAISGTTSDAIFGTSSDAIIEGLHKGEFVEPGQTPDETIPGDKEQIVNQQEQQRIVNPGVKELDDRPAVENSTDTSLNSTDTSLLNEDGKDIFRDTDFRGDENISEDTDDKESKPPVKKS